MSTVIKGIVLHHANTKPDVILPRAIIETEILIHAPVHRIFKYLSVPHNLPRIWSSLIEIKNEKLLPNGGYSADWVYKMAGMHFAGNGEYTEVVLNQYFTIRTKGALNSSITMTFRPTDNETRVTLTIDYRIPTRLLAWLTRKIIVKINEQEADLILVNLKAMMEESWYIRKKKQDF